MDRREFLRATLGLAAGPVAGCVARPFPVHSPNSSSIPEVASDTLVNDVHSQLNSARVDSIVKPARVEQLQDAVRRAHAAGKPICVAGGRHAMGGQQFGEASILVDTRALNRVLDFDRDRGSVAIEGGIQWPQLLMYLNREQDDGVDSGESIRSRPAPTASVSEAPWLAMRTAAD